MKLEKFSHLKVIITIIFLLLDFGHNTEAAPEASLITSLPGFNGNFPSKHYSGYVTIEGESEPKNLFYYLVQSESDPSNDPVVLWLNGGPGCSSFDGFIYEHGPFNFEAANSTGNLPKLHLNPYSWSKVSNILYLDSPTGVGFSYSKNTVFYKTGDLEAAVDTHNFLLKWFYMYPELQSNPFYIAGESYAGVYIPTLASNVVKGIKAGEKPIINMKGYMIGNGVTDNDFDGNAYVPFAHGMALISEDMYKEAVAACKGKLYSPTTARCTAILTKIDTATEGLNVYDILEPCYHKPSDTKLGDDDKSKNTTIPSSFKQLGKTNKLMPVRKRIYGRSWPYKYTERVVGQIATMWPQLMQGESQSNQLSEKPKTRSVPCTDDTVATSWLNNAGVKKALHVNPEFTGTWELCTGDLKYQFDVGSMIDYHKNLTALGYRALIFSGDHDFCVPYTGSEAWTRAMGYKIIDEWRSWTSNDQVAGFTQGYDHGLTFLTVKGSGHTVPEYKPREALDFYTRWLQEKPI